MLKRSISNSKKCFDCLSKFNACNVIPTRVVDLDILPTNVAAKGDIIDPILDTVDAIPSPTLLQ